MRVALFDDVLGGAVKQFDVTWGEIFQRAAAPEIYAEKKQLPLIKLSTFGDVRTNRGSLRHDGNLLSVSGVEGDYDAGILTPGDAVRLLDVAGIYALVYTTPSHLPWAPRWRVLAPLSVECGPWERAEYVGRINAALGGVLAGESFTLSQTYYWGAVTGVQYECLHTSGGNYVDLVQIPAVYPAVMGNTSGSLVTSDAVTDAHLIPDLESALGFINADDRDVWIAVGQDLCSLGEIGFKLWDDWSRKSEKYNELDSRSRFATFSGDRTDYRAVLAKAGRSGWVNPAALRSRDLSEVVFDTPVVGVVDDNHGYMPFVSPLDDASKFIHVNIRGKKLATVENLEYVLKQYGISYYYDELLKEQFVTYPNGHDITNDMSINGKLQRIRSLLSANEIAVEASAFLSTLLMNESVNPIRQWVTGAPWDGIDRVRSVLDSVHVTIDDRDYRDKALRTWFTQCVAAMDGSQHSPRRDKTAKYESVLVFQSAQGAFKTSWVKSLVPSEYKTYIKESVTLDLNNPDSIKAAISGWICELGELDATFRKSDIARLKSFLSNTGDIFRLPYDRAHSTFQRRTSFFGTVNESKFLTDDTGNRRFLPLAIRYAEPIDDSVIDKQQFWAQLYLEYVGGAQWWSDYELEGMLQVRHQQHSQLCPIEEVLSSTFDLSGEGSVRLNCTEIFTHLNWGKPNKRDLNTLAAVLAAHGLTYHKSGGKRFYLLDYVNPFLN